MIATARVDYSEYLNGYHWRTFRRKVLNRNPKCAICRAPANVVHHLTYERLGNEQFDDVKSLCAPCHERLHKAHVDYGTSYTKFAETVELMGGVSVAKNRKKNKWFKSDGSYWSNRGAIARFMAIDLHKRRTVESLTGSGVPASEIAKSHGWDAQEVAFIVAYLERKP